MRRERIRPSAVSRTAAAALTVAALLLTLLAPRLVPCSADEPSTQPTTRPATQPAAVPARLSPAELAVSVQTWFGDLTHADAAVRSEAITNLMALKADELPVLQKVVQQSMPLAPAQASVLKQIVTQAYLASCPYDADPQAGFLGVHPEIAMISFRDDGGAQGVYVTSRMVGFVGARMLRDGDLILSILERPEAPLAQFSGFSTAVSGLGAGTVVHFQVLREGKIIWIAIPLDPRPIGIDDQDSLAKFKKDRETLAATYWNTTFAPLLEPEPKRTADTRDHAATP